jgi:hypothetical protein
MKQKSLASKLKKSLMACGAAMLLCGLSPVNAQLYVDGGSIAGPLLGGSPGVGLGYVGIGTNAPERQLEIKNTGTTVNNTWFMVTNDDPDGATSSPGFAMRKSKGSPGAPTPVTVGDRLGFFLAGGWDDSGIYRNASGITFKIDGAVSPGIVPANVEIETGTPTRFTRFKVYSDGRCEIININSNIGEYLMVDTDGTITTGAMSGGGTSNWDAVGMPGAGAGHIWYSQGAAVGDETAVMVDFSIEQNNSMGIASVYSGPQGMWDPVGVWSWVGAGANSGIGIEGDGAYTGGWFSGAVFSIFCESEMMVNGDVIVLGTLTSSSDARLKENVQAMDNGMADLLKLKPSQYNYKTAEYPTMNLSEGTNYGFIAQELQEVFPTLVKTNVGGSNAEGKFEFLSVNYQGLIPVMVSAIQNRQAVIEAITERIEAVEEQLKDELALRQSGVAATIELADVRPNPVVDNAQIAYNVQDATQAQIDIYEATTGRLVQSYKVSGQGTVNVTGLNAGHYTYTLYADNVKVASKKMVVIK